VGYYQKLADLSPLQIVLRLTEMFLYVIHTETCMSLIGLYFVFCAAVVISK